MGKCAELCGVDHSRMLFNVKVVSPERYQQHLKDLAEEGPDRLHPGGHRADGPRQECGDEQPVSILNEPQGAAAADGSYEHELPVRRKQPGNVVVKWLTTTDHKTIGTLYLVTSFVFFCIGGVMALFMRAELARPGHADHVERAVQPGVHDARHDHAADVRDAAVRRLRELDHAAADRRARRGVPAAEHVRVLALPLRLAHRGRRLPHPAGRGRLRLVRLLPAVGRGPLAGHRRRHVDHGSGLLRLRHDPRLGQLHHHDHLHARARHDDVPDADLHLERAADRGAGAAGLPGAGRRAARAGGGPEVRRACLRRGQRRGVAVAAPLLVLRPSRGVHHRAAVLRHHLRGHPGLQPQADVRLHRSGRARPSPSPVCR